jgi:hypothetical protein
MRFLRTVLTVGLAAPLVTAPALASAWASPPAVSPRIDTVAIALAAPEAGPQSTATAATLLTPEVQVETFAGVGATWSGSRPATELPHIEVRVGSGAGWSRWAGLPALEEGPDPDTAEGRRAVQAATALLWVGDSQRVQARITGPAAGLPDGVELALVDPGRSPADDLPAHAAASADAAAPPIISRKQWGADESLRNCDASYNDTIKAVVVHHTAGPNGYATAADAMRQLRGDYAYHTERLGWCDLGYNFVVDTWGTIYEGRAGGISRPVVGAHAGGFNTDTFGVALLGTYTGATPPPAQQQAAADLIGWKLARHRADPEGTTTLTSAGGGTSRYPAGQAVQLPVVMGHRDVGATACPGDAGYATLPTLRSLAAARQRISGR